MTGFAGVVAIDKAARDGRFEEYFGRARTPRGKKPVLLRTDDAIFVQEIQATAASAGFARQPVSPSLECDGGVLFAADCRLDNRAELGAALDIAPGELVATPDSTLIFRMLRRWGDAGLARCLGAFAIALWDPQERRLTLARDYLGDRALYFHRGRGRVSFATTLGALLSLPHVPREIDDIMMAGYLALNVNEPHRTFYRGIERVPSRSAVTIDSAEIRHRHYWSPDFDAAPPYRRDEDYIARARELFDQAVVAATADTPHIGISTSGGLDSSAIAATAARLGRAARISCYTLTPPPGAEALLGPQSYGDERGKVEALGRMYPGLELHFLTDETSHPFESDDVRLFARANVPVLGPSNLGAYGHIYDAVVAGGHSTVLMGIYGNFALTWDGRFSLPALLQAGRLGTLAREAALLARHDRRGPVHAIGSEIRAHMAPRWAVRWLDRLKARDFENISRWSAINPDFVAEHDLARQWRAQGFDLWQGPRLGRDPVRLRAHFLFDGNQIARDHMAESPGVFGFEARNPHADRRLLEFALAVPEPMYRRNGVPRSFARDVFADRLPPAILDERRRGAHGVNWFRRLNARRGDIATEIDRLDASPLARRLIDLPRLKALMTQWPKDAAEAERRRISYRAMLCRAVHVGHFIRWVEGGNA